MRLKDTNEMFADDLRDPAYAAGYLNISLEDDGIEGFLYALQKVARAHGVSKVAENSCMARESLYRALSDKGNPGVRPLARVLDALGLRLTVTPATEGDAMRQTATEDQGKADQPILMQEEQAQPILSFGVEMSDLHRLMADELAAMRKEAAAQQEAARREADNLREEVLRMVALTEQMLKAVAGQAADNRQRTYRDPAPSTPYSFPLGKSKKQQVNAEVYQPTPLKLVRTGS